MEADFKLTRNVLSLAISAAIGAAMGWIGGPVFVLIPWAIVGLAIGTFCDGPKAALINGGIYGFVLSFVFMLAGYNGTQSVASVLPLFTILGLFGGLCELTLSLLGNLLARRGAKKRKERA